MSIVLDKEMERSCDVEHVRRGMEGDDKSDSTVGNRQRGRRAIEQVGGKANEKG